MPTTYLNAMKFFSPEPQYVIAFVKENIPLTHEKQIIDFKKVSDLTYNTDLIYDTEY